MSSAVAEPKSQAWEEFSEKDFQMAPSKLSGESGAGNKKSRLGSASGQFLVRDENC